MGQLKTPSSISFQEQLSDEKNRGKELESELGQEIAKLSKTCSEQQAVINAAITKGPANNTEACLQHEITRLTGENFDLREKIENLNDNIKRLKRQLRSYVKKLNEVGVAVPEPAAAAAASSSEAGAEAGQEVSPLAPSLPEIRKKEQHYLGMFEYKQEQEQHVLKALIYGKGGRATTFMIFKALKNFPFIYNIKMSRC